MMCDVEVKALRQALDTLNDARAAYRAQQPTWRVESAVRDRLTAAWVALASLVPDELVISLEDVPPCDPGAPMPMVVSDGWTTWLTYHFAGHSDNRALVTFEGVDSVLFGGPNDEALSGHRLANNGLRPYAFQEVLRSSWIADRERENSVHERHEPGWHARLRHFVFTFHDETFECLAWSYAVGATESTHPAALLTQRPGKSVTWTNPGFR